MKQIFMVCGVPGSGKTWVCEQVAHKYCYLPNDAHIGGNYVDAIDRAQSKLPLLIDCPFGETKLREQLEARGWTVVPLFIIEDAATVKRRYEAREGKPVSNAILTRADSIVKRALEWDAVSGPSEYILNWLRVK